MKSFLLFSLGIAALFSLVPLSTWLATGRWRDAVWAAKRYGLLMLVLLGIPAAVGTLIAAIDLLLA